MPAQVIAAAAPDDEPPHEPFMSASDADVLLDDVAIERWVRSWLDAEIYDDQFPDRYEPPLPELTELERREAARRLRALRDRRNRAYRFVCSRAATARQARDAR